MSQFIYDNPAALHAHLNRRRGGGLSPSAVGYDTDGTYFLACLDMDHLRVVVDFDGYISVEMLVYPVTIMLSGM